MEQRPNDVAVEDVLIKLSREECVPNMEQYRQRNDAESKDAHLLL